MGPSPPALPNPQLCPSFSLSLGAGKWFQDGKTHVFGEASLSHLFRSLLWLSRHLCSETCTPSLLSHLSHTHVHPGAPHPHPGHMLRVSRSGSPVGTQGMRDGKVNTLGWFQEDAVMGFQSCPLSTSIHHHSLTITGWHPRPVGCFGDMASWSCPSFTALGFLVFEGPSCPGDPHPPGLWFFFLRTLLHLSLNICWKLWWGLEDPEHALEMGSCAPLLSGLYSWARGWLLRVGFGLTVAQSSFACRAHGLVSSFSPHCQRAGGSGPSWHSCPRRWWAEHTPGAPTPFSVLSGHCLLSGTVLLVPNISLQKTRPQGEKRSLGNWALGDVGPLALLLPGRKGPPAGPALPRSWPQP